MIEEGTEKLKSGIIRHADLKTAMFNAPYGPYLKAGDHFPYKLSDFVDKDLLQKVENRKITKKEQSKSWSSAGRACVKQYEDLK